MHRYLLPLLLAASASTPALHAQVPEGWAVASIAQTPGNLPGGLMVFDPHRTQVSWSVAGLPSDLTGIGSGATRMHGANSVLVRPEDGRIVVGEWTRLNGDTLEIHEIELTGRVASRGTRHVIGVRNNPRKASVDQMAWLPDGRVLFTQYGHDNTAINGSDIAILELGSGALTAVPATGTPPSSTHFINGMTVDEAGTTAYLGYSDRNTPRTSTIYSVSIPGGGAARRILTLSGRVVMQLKPDGVGGLYIATQASPGLLHWNGDQTRIVTQLPSGVNALDVDRTTGELLAMALSVNGIVFHRVTPNGVRRVVLTLPPGSSQPSGVAIRPDMEVSGPRSAGAHGWLVEPNPGGSPLLGNGGFGITVDSGASRQPSYVLIGDQATDVPVLGMRLLVRPVVSFPFTPSAARHDLGLPIPADPALAGLRLYAQTVHDSGRGWLASSRLRFTIH